MLYGITNGIVLSGTVTLPVEFGNTDTNGNLEQLFLSDPSGTNGDYNGTYFADICPINRQTALSASGTRHR